MPLAHERWNLESSSPLIIIEGCSNFYEDRYNFKIICEEFWSEIEIGADLASLFQKSEAKKDDSCSRDSARSFIWYLFPLLFEVGSA